MALFIAGGTPLDRVQLERRRRVELGLPPARHLFVYTPEDIVLQKLRWFRRGGEVSDRQWGDVLGVLAVCAGRLDIGYMRAQASVIAVEGLLEQALSQVRGA